MKITILLPLIIIVTIRLLVTETTIMTIREAGIKIIMIAVIITT